MRNFINIEHHFAPHSLTRRGMRDYARRVYNYTTLMLADLSPRSPATRAWPCYLWPPPQLMVGYPYLVRVCNDYTFDQRTFSLLGFRDRRTRQSRTLDWNCLAACSYTINVGHYLRFLDIDNFEETLADIQQSLLSDRIVADLQLADPMSGVGMWRLPGDNQQQLRGEGIAGEEQRRAAAAATPSLQALLHQRFRHLQDCGPEAWGLCQRAAGASAAEPQPFEEDEPAAPPQDILAAIRRLRSAYFRFLLLHQQRRQRRRRPTSLSDDYGDPPAAQQAFLDFLPHRADPPRPPAAFPEDSPWTSQDWLRRFVEAFAVPLRDDNELLLSAGSSISRGGGSASSPSSSQRASLAANKEHTLMTVQAVIDALTLPHRLPRDQRRHELQGGAVQLRPRVNGRAVTATMRRQRGDVVSTFIDSLPLPTRRRFRAPPASQVISEQDEDDEPEDQEEEEPDMEDDEEAEDDIFADMPPLEGDEDEDWWWVADPAERARRRRLLRQQETQWLREIRAAIAEAVRLLQNELLAQAANYEQAFFDFPRDFYAAMRRLQEVDDVNETTLRRWVVYFFVCEHVAATLNYLHGRLVRQVYAQRHLHILGAQLVMRAYAADGTLAFTRVWHESQQERSFADLMTRVARDLSAIVERAGLARLDDGDLRDMLEDIAWRENSGEIQDVLDQVTLNDGDIDRLDLSFRIRIEGPVAISSNNSIQAIQRRVIRVARERLRNSLPLPQPNEPLMLPEDPRPPVQRRR